ncbi:hypothetical protein [Bifidobacterium vespertilionis]|uniref:hypothetical protein n=1 Tax=Bifidobacterium vespertilionis TaxID=2562524 RepID=UPI001CC305DB|nr:hypothetical protein [Bifidobacterium vespertilionis]
MQQPARGRRIALHEKIPVDPGLDRTIVPIRRGADADRHQLAAWHLALAATPTTVGIMPIATIAPVTPYVSHHSPDHLIPTIAPTIPPIRSAIRSLYESTRPE